MLFKMHLCPEDILISFSVWKPTLLLKSSESRNTVPVFWKEKHMLTLDKTTSVRGAEKASKDFPFKLMSYGAINNSVLFNIPN